MQAGCSLMVVINVWWLNVCVLLMVMIDDDAVASCEVNKTSNPKT